MATSQRWFLFSVALTVGGLLYLLGPILSPFLAGALLAYLTDPLADKLEDMGASRTTAVIVVFSFISLVFVLLLVLLLPKLSHQIGVMIAQIPQVIGLVEQQLLPNLQALLGEQGTSLDLNFIKPIITNNWQQTGDFLRDIISQVTKSGLAVAGWLANLLLVPVVLFYLLRDWDIMMAKIGRLLPRNVEPKVRLWANECDEVLGAFIKGQLMVMICLGAVYAIGLMIVGLDLALLLGMLAGLASIVPYMGFIVGIVAAGVAAFIQFGDPLVLVWVGVVFGVGQALEGMVLTPLLVGDRIGLHPVAVIFAIMAGGQLFGFVGILIALPVAAVIMVLLRHLHEGYKNSSLYGEDHQELVAQMPEQQQEVAEQSEVKSL